MKIYGSTNWSAAFRTVVLSGNTVFWMFLLAPKLLWQWWRNIFTERLRDCADMYINGSINRAILQTVVYILYTSLLLSVCSTAWVKAVFVEDAILFLVVFWCHMLSLDFFGLCFELVEGVLMTTHESNHSEQTVWTRMVRLPEKPFPVLVCYGPIYIVTIPNLCMCCMIFVFCGCRRSRVIFAHGMITQI